jgi:twitching motility protein PilT
MGPLVNLEPPTEAAAEQFIRQALSNDKATDFFGRRGAGEGRIDDTQAGPVRVHAWRSQSGYNLSLRLLSDTVPILSSLGLPEIVKDIPGIRNGLVLITGETGSGKTTTQAAIIGEILDKWDGHIITFEDPIEYVHRAFDADGMPRKSKCEQIEIGRHMQTFTEGVRSALRSDPDVIMLGEMRDPDEIKAGIQAAETGHLVLATGHDQRATKTVERLVNAFPPVEADMIRHAVANVLQVVVSLRLLPRKNGKGMTPVAEVLRTNDGIRELIRNPNKTSEIHGALKQNVHLLKTQTLEMALAAAVKADLISLAIAKAETDNGDLLQKELSAVGIYNA